MANKKRKGPAKAGDAHQAPPFSPDEQTAAHAQNHGAEAATSEAAADLIATTKKKRTGLSPKGRDTRYAADTLTGGGCYLDGQRARKERSPDQAVRAHKKARAAAAASHELEFGVDDSPDGGGEMFELDAESRPTGGGISAGRRTAIFYSFVSIHGSPPESEWDGRGGTVSQICAWPRLPGGVRRLCEGRQVQRRHQERRRVVERGGGGGGGGVMTHGRRVLLFARSRARRAAAARVSWVRWRALPCLRVQTKLNWWVFSALLFLFT